MPVANGIEVEFVNAGHLLGSSYVRMRIDGRTILFGGDLGRFGRPVLPDPTPVAEADYLLVESTYGNRVHEQDDNGDRLAAIVKETAHKGGKLIIPAFAIGRVEELVYWLKRLESEKRIPVLPVFVDSPMAAAALARYTERVQELDPELQPEEHDDKAPHDAAAPNPPDVRRRQARQEREMCVFCTERFRVIGNAEESKQLTASKMPSIVISASGMAEGGRVLHHLKAALPDARNTVLFAGYQAAGTRGRRLVDGEKSVKIHGEWIPGRRPDRAHRLDVGARRRQRDHALARRLHRAAEADLHRARRTGGAGRAGRAHPGRTGLGAQGARAPGESDFEFVGRRRGRSSLGEAISLSVSCYLVPLADLRCRCSVDERRVRADVDRPVRRHGERANRIDLAFQQPLGSDDAPAGPPDRNARGGCSRPSPPDQQVAARDETRRTRRRRARAAYRTARGRAPRRSGAPAPWDRRRRSTARRWRPS